MARVGASLEAYYVSCPDLLREMVRPKYHLDLWDVDPPSEDEERLRGEEDARQRVAADGVGTEAWRWEGSDEELGDGATSSGGGAKQEGLGRAGQRKWTLPACSDGGERRRREEHEGRARALPRLVVKGGCADPARPSLAHAMRWA